MGFLFASRLRSPSEEPFDDRREVEVPAAVLCATCGRCDCPGCRGDGPADGASGMIALVPWERSGRAWHVRLLDTVDATTIGAPTFFRTLPEGLVAPALRFAALAEVLAVGSTALVLAPLVMLAVPGLLLRCLLYSSTRTAVVGTLTAGVVGFSVILLIAHAVHGLWLGRHGRRAVALRVGLYACGWDLGSSPLGVLAFAVRSGISRAAGMFVAALRAPTVSVDAALLGPLGASLAASRVDAARTRRSAFAVSLATILPLIVGLLVAMVWIAIREP